MNYCQWEKPQNMQLREGFITEQSSIIKKKKKRTKCTRQYREQCMGSCGQKKKEAVEEM